MTVKGANDTKIIITDHALKRAKRRGNKGGLSIVQFARKALYLGLGFENSKGALLEFIKNKYQSEYRANNIRVYGHEVYIFRNNVLLTMLDLPKYLWSDWDSYSKEVLKNV